MPRRRAPRGDQTRRRVAHEAARIMSEQGVDDYLQAKRKAAERLGVTDQASLPRNAEIEQALIENQRLFSADKHRTRLADYRDTAAEVLRLFPEFEPRVTGAVLSGAVSAGADVELHLFTDTPEQVTLRLMDAGIPYRLVDRRMRMSGNGHVRYPGYHFIADEVPVLLVVFPRDGIRQAPCSPVDGKPMKRADLRELQLLTNAS
ncbi:MAG: hypothetical protein KJO55_10535 [Gammaproteobacteria bacterium]|nr:hypothetical protein [Gammaproteobacteria bacterium]NND60874.1 hypothetical protein [Gammaproteobacteria bacterium]